MSRGDRTKDEQHFRQPCRAVHHLIGVKQLGGLELAAATGALNAPVPHTPQAPNLDVGQNTRSAPGDTLIIDGAGMAGLPLLGTIVAILGDDGAPPYLVRWTGGDYESRVFPGSGAHIEKHR